MPGQRVSTLNLLQHCMSFDASGLHHCMHSDVSPLLPDTPWSGPSCVWASQGGGLGTASLSLWPVCTGTVLCVGHAVEFEHVGGVLIAVGRPAPYEPRHGGMYASRCLCDCARSAACAALRCTLAQTLAALLPSSNGHLVGVPHDS